MVGAPAGCWLPPLSTKLTSTASAQNGRIACSTGVEERSANWATAMADPPGWAREQAVETLNAALVEGDGQKQAELLGTLREVLVFNAPELLPEFVPRLLELQMYPVGSRPQRPSVTPPLCPPCFT